MNTSPTLVTPVLGVASATSLATSAASPLLLTNGQLTTIALTSQTIGATTLTIPDFASVSDTFVFNTKAATLSNKTFVAPALGTPASGVATNLTGTAAGLTAGNVTTNANLTGPITSVGNATSIAAQTGTGTTFVMNTSPTITTSATVLADDASNTTVTYLQRLSHTTSGVPAAGIGTGLEFEAETSAANNEIGASLAAVVTDATLASEDFDLVFKNMAAGAAATETFRLSSTGLTTLGAAGTDGSLKFYNELGATDYDVTIQPSASQSASYTLTLPTAQASGTQVLQNNGSGVLSWATAAGGDITAVGDTASGAAFNALG